MAARPAAAPVRPAAARCSARCPRRSESRAESRGPVVRSDFLAKGLPLGLAMKVRVFLASILRGRALSLFAWTKSSLTGLPMKPQRARRAFTR